MYSKPKCMGKINHIHYDHLQTLSDNDDPACWALRPYDPDLLLKYLYSTLSRTNIFFVGYFLGAKCITENFLLHYVIAKITSSIVLLWCPPVLPTIPIFWLIFTKITFTDRVLWSVTPK